MNVSHADKFRLINISKYIELLDFYISLSELP